MYIALPLFDHFSFFSSLPYKNYLHVKCILFIYLHSLFKRDLCCHFPSCCSLRCEVFPLCPLTPSIASTQRAQSQHRQPFEWPNAASCIWLIRGHPRGWDPLKPLSPLSSMISKLHLCTGGCDSHIDFFRPPKGHIYRSFIETRMEWRVWANTLYISALWLLICKATACFHSLYFLPLLVILIFLFSLKLSTSFPCVVRWSAYLLRQGRVCPSCGIPCYSSGTQCWAAGSFKPDGRLSRRCGCGIWSRRTLYATSSSIQRCVPSSRSWNEGSRVEISHPVLLLTSFWKSSPPRCDWRPLPWENYKPRCIGKEMIESCNLRFLIVFHLVLKDFNNWWHLIICRWDNHCSLSLCYLAKVGKLYLKKLND